MERMFPPGFTALFVLALALPGCNADDGNNDGVVDSGDTSSNPDDTADPTDYVVVDVVVHAAIDGELVDPVGVCLHEASGETGSEATLATAVTTGEVIKVNVLKSGQQARAWIGPATAEKSSDGHRILEYNGRQWVHPLADFTVNEDGCDETTMNVVDVEGCEPTANLNGYFPYELHHCTMDANEYDANDPEFKGAYIYSEEADRWLEVTNGHDIIDEGDAGMNGFLDEQCTLQSFGSTFAVDCPDDGMWTIDSSWTGNGFTISASHYDSFVTTLTCVLQ